MCMAVLPEGYMPVFPSIRSEQYPATADTQCINLIIPAGDEFKALAFGLLNLASNVYSYDDPETAQTAGLAAVWADSLYLSDWLPCMENTQSANNSLLVFADEFAIDTGGSNLLTIATTQMHNFYVRQSPSENGDIRECFRYMVAGDWNSRLIAIKTVASGKMLPQVQDADGNITVLTERDLYGSAAFNQVYDDTFTLAVSGLTRLIIGTNGKNASSSDYDVNVTLWSLWRNA